jgi:hypothetical protein
MPQSMLYPPLLDESLGESLAPWLTRSVNDYFAAIVWEPLPPPLPIVAHPEAPPLTLAMTVVEYFANFPWGGSVATPDDDLTTMPLTTMPLTTVSAPPSDDDEMNFEELFAASFDDRMQPDSGDPAPSGPSLTDFSDFL